MVVEQDTEDGGQQGRELERPQTASTDDSITNAASAIDDAFLLPSRASLSWITRHMPIILCFQRSPSLIVAQLVGLVQAIFVAAFDSTVTTHAQELYDFNSQKAGLLFIPLSAANFVVGPIGGWLIDKYGVKPVATVGFTYLVPVLMLLRIPTAEPMMHQVIILGALLGLSGIGLALIGAPSIVEAGAVVEKFHKKNPGLFGENGPYGQLYALSSMVFCLGLSLGPGIAGGLKGLIGYGNMNAVLAVISGVTAVLSLLYLGGPLPVWKRVRKSVRRFSNADS